MVNRKISLIPQLPHSLLAWVLLAGLAFGPMFGQSDPGNSHLKLKVRNPDAVIEPTAYILGPADEIQIQAIDADGISNDPIRIDSSGYIRLPLAGRVQAAGLTVHQLENEIATRLKPYIKEPQVVVTLTDPRSNPISILGAVRDPGVHQIQGPKTLIEALALAGGLVDDSGYRIRITRNIQYGPIPLADAYNDPSGAYSLGEVNVEQLLEGENPAMNFQIRPHDVITVPRAEKIYVVGEVNRAGGFTLHEKETLSVLQALSLANGLTKTAKSGSARLLRVSSSSSGRLEIPVDLSAILAGKAEDIRMRADDVLFVPNSAFKSAGLRAIEAAIQLGTGIVIWRR